MELTRCASDGTQANGTLRAELMRMQRLLSTVTGEAKAAKAAAAAAEEAARAKYGASAADDASHHSPGNRRGALHQHVASLPSSVLDSFDCQVRTTRLES